MRPVFEQMPPAFQAAELDTLEVSSGKQWARVVRNYPAIARPFLRASYRTQSGRRRFWARVIDALEARAPAGEKRKLCVRIKRGKKEIRHTIIYKGRKL